MIVLAFAIGYLAWRLVEVPIRKWRGSTFDYVFVDDQGCVREVTDSEDQYLTSSLFPVDKSFFLKRRFQTRNAEGGLSGYLKRRDLPRKILIEPASSRK